MYRLTTFIIVLLIVVTASRNTFKKTPLDGQVITYGSIVKLFHPQTMNMLHSHGIRFSMDGIFSVTGYRMDDLGSYWQIREKHLGKSKTFKDPIKCGDTILIVSSIMDYFLRTEQTATGLTSNLDQLVQGLSRQAQIDERVNWNIHCETKSDGQDILFGDMIRLKHMNTGKYASLTKQMVYHEGNCGRGCVIAGHLQPHAIEQAQDDKSIFQIVAGMNFQNNDEKQQKEQ